MADKVERSWSKPPKVDGLIGRKKVDWSIFESSGTHIPSKFHEDFAYANDGDLPARGETREVTLIINDEPYKAEFKAISIEDRDRALRLFWNQDERLKSLLKDTFQTSYATLDRIRREYSQDDSRQKIYAQMPDDEAEHIEFYQTATPYTYRVNLVSRDAEHRHSRRWWWVNQGFSREFALSKPYLWAPKQTKSGRVLTHHKSVSELRTGDIVFNYAKGFLRGYSVVQDLPIESTYPDDEKSYSGTIGYLVNTEFHPFEDPLPLNVIPEGLRIPRHGPFDRTGGVRQGYLYRLSEAVVLWLANRLAEEFPQLKSMLSSDSVEECPPYTVEDMAAETGFSVATIRTWLRALDRKSQIILYGPPGTGKTFVAQRLARVVSSPTGGRVDTVQFHPAYAYEDFVRGTRPVPDADTLKLEVRDGRFVEFCKNAENFPSRRHVLIIDEINRASLSRVFGELMYLLEYRGKSVSLAQGDDFGIPNNVFVIGTMNTADRSIALVDYALRRRFAFIRLDPDLSILSRYYAEDESVKSLLAVVRDMNLTIEDPNYYVGISFFIHSEGLSGLKRDLPIIWTTEIEPYLEEYFYDQVAKVGPFRWENLKATKLREWTE